MDLESTNLRFVARKNSKLNPPTRDCGLTYKVHNDDNVQGSNLPRDQSHFYYEVQVHSQLYHPDTIQMRTCFISIHIVCMFFLCYCYCCLLDSACLYLPHTIVAMSIHKFRKNRQ